MHVEGKGITTCPALCQFVTKLNGTAALELADRQPERIRTGELEEYFQGDKEQPGTWACQNSVFVDLVDREVGTAKQVGDRASRCDLAAARTQSKIAPIALFSPGAISRKLQGG